MADELVSQEDAALLCAENPDAQLQIGALCFFDAAPLRDDNGELRMDDLRSHISARLAGIPRFRQRIASLPLEIARPAWVDDEYFDIGRHVRCGQVSDPGGDPELRAFVNDLLDSRLDPAHPLWDVWFIDGLDQDRVAVLLRVHHVMADGLALLDAALLLLDPEPDSEPDSSAPWSPEPTPSTVARLARAVPDRLHQRLGLALRASRLVLDPRWGIRALRGADGLGRAWLRTAPSMSITSRVGAHRDMSWASLHMSELLAIKRARGTTLNDVVLAITAGAVRRHLGHEELRSRPRVLVPVGNVGDSSSEGTGNRFSMIVTELPVDLDDPLERLSSVHELMDEAKASNRASSTSHVFSLVDLIPLKLIKAVAPEVLARQPFVNLALTDLPGSRTPGYLLGARLHSLHPVVTGVGNIAVIIAVISYVDELGVGITVDPAVVRDPDHLMDCFRGAAEELFRACI